MATNFTRMSLTLRPEISERLDKYVSVTEIPKVRVINRALDLYLKQIEKNSNSDLKTIAQ